MYVAAWRRDVALLCGSVNRRYAGANIPSGDFAPRNAHALIPSFDERLLAGGGGEKPAYQLAHRRTRVDSLADARPYRRHACIGDQANVMC